MNETDCATQHKCPVCFHSEMTVFFEVNSAPVFCNVLWPSRAEALAASRAPIRLAYCRKCGLIYNIALAPQLLEYSPSYENSLHFSLRFQKYAEETANRLIQQYQLRNKDIIEIGCGQGDFLAMLQRLGNNRVLGFDPSYTPEKAAVGAARLSVRVLPEAYSKTHAQHPVDFICCRHVLEHIDRPLDFLKNMRNVIGQRHDCVVYFEVPNALYTFKSMGVWDIIYEHCSYFTSESLANVFMRAGFVPIHLTEQYDSQFLTIEARPGIPDTSSISNKKKGLPDINSLIRKFQSAYREKLDGWQHRLSHIREQNDRVVLWGAGSKGVTFLNALDISYKRVEYIVDINPRKHENFIAGTGQQVVAPKFLKQYNPQIVIIMNPVYHTEIQQVIEGFNITPELVLA